MSSGDGRGGAGLSQQVELPGKQGQAGKELVKEDEGKGEANWAKVRPCWNVAGGGMRRDGARGMLNCVDHGGLM